MPMSNKIQELTTKLQEINFKIEMKKNNFKEVIDMAGDIDEKFQEINTMSEERKGLEITDLPISKGMENINKITQLVLADQMKPKLKSLSMANSYNIKLEQKKSESTQIDEVRYGGLLISIDHETEEIKQLKLQIIKREHILKLYSLLCVEEILTNNDRIWIYKKKHEKDMHLNHRGTEGLIDTVNERSYTRLYKSL